MEQKNSKIISRTSEYIKFIFFLLDLVVLNLSFYLSSKLIFGYNFVNDLLLLKPLLVFSNLIWLLLVAFYNAYQIRRIETIEVILSRSLKMILSLITILGLVVFTLNYSSIPKVFFIFFSLIFISIDLTFRSLFLFYLRSVRKKGINNRKVIIVGVNKSGLELEQLLKREVEFGYKVLGFFTVDKDTSTSSSKIIGHIDNLEEYLSNTIIDEVYFTATNYPEKQIKKLITFCDKNFIRFKIIPQFKEFTLNRHVNIDFYENIPVLILRKEPLENFINKSIKRIFDIIFSLIVIILIMPWLFPLVALVQLLTSKGPVFFIQLRSGQDNKVFKCLKFRTMYVNDKANEIGTLDNDPRITPFGKFLRKSRIDELPQFFNVFVGQMSVVGPRPHMLKHTEEYSQLIDEFLVRHFVKPGITGWAQATGYIDESRKLQEMQDKVKNDIYYIENWSFMLDMKIIFLTIYNAIKGDKNAK